MPSPATGPARSEKAAFWSSPLAELFTRLNATPAGLSSAEAASRLARYGPNVLRATRRQTFLLLALSRFKNPLVILLIVASGISALTGELTLTSLTVVALAALLPLTPLASALGFVAPPPRFFLILAAMVAVYLAGVQAVKTWFYRSFTHPDG
jgi:magnesium-transporting ATPase (P-type)